MLVRRCALYVAAVVLLCGSHCSAQLMSGGWPKFRGNILNSGRSTASGPAAATLGWSYATGADITGSPAISASGVVYVVSQDQYLYAISPSGSMLWRYNVHSDGTSSPAIGQAGEIYVGSDDFGVYCLNPDGTLNWRTPLGKAIKSSPTIGSDGTIYVGALDNKVSALNSSGVVQWSYTTGGAVYSSPAVGASGNIYVGSDDGYLYCLTPAGVRSWRYRAAYKVQCAPALDDSGNIYITSTDGRVYSVSPAGVLRWSYALPASTYSSPAIGPDGSIYVGCDNSRIYALTSSGTFRWSYTTGGAVKSSPAVGSNGMVYAGCADGYIYAINSDGTLAWRSSLGGAVTSSPAIAADGTLVVGSADDSLYSFISDTSPPAAPVVTDDGVYSTSPDSLHATWSASDAESGISQYSYAIGTTPGGTDVADWTSAGAATEVTRSGLSLTLGTTYYFAVRAANGVGLWSPVGVSDGVIVDYTAPTGVSVIDDGDYISSGSTLHAVWSAQDAQSGVAEYEYCIGSSSGAENVVGWTSTGTATSITRTDIALIEGSTYYFGVRARSGAGLWSSGTWSNGITVDRVPPTTPVVIDDGAYTADRTQLHASWSATDAVSGIAAYEYAIGTTAGGTNVVGWTSTGTATSVTRTGLNLTDGVTYYFAVRARDGAGGWSAVGTSNGILVDTTPPTTPVVTDGGEYTSSPDTLSAQWASIDAQSGIVEYQYAIGTTAGGTQIVGWTSTGTTSQVTKTGLSLVVGTTYYFAVRARNGAGGWSAVGTSDGIKFDNTPPSAPVVTDDGQYTSIRTALHAIWSANDVESGIAEYQYRIGTTAGGGEVVDWTSAGAATEVTRTGLNLTDGVTYYISARAKNGAGIWGAAGTSNGIIVDGSPPTTPAVTDTGQYTTSTNALSASWTSSDPQSGVAEYRIAVGTTPGGTQLLSWTSTGTVAHANLTGLPLVNGATYYFSVRARSAAGMWSADGYSDGILVDYTAPPAPTVIDDGGYTSSMSTLHATWSAIDAESGVASYEYAVGTSPGGSDVIAWTAAGTATEATRTGLELFNGVMYYWSVRATNRAGLVSTVGSSDGIRVDTTAPGRPIVTDDGEYATSLSTMHASWTAVDPESGISEYEYAIGTVAGGTDILGWTSAGTANEVTKSGLALTNGLTYYWAVRAHNGAGLLGPVGMSDGIIVVVTAAWSKFHHDAANIGTSEFTGSKSGGLLWQFTTTDWIESSPALGGDGTSYFGCGDGALYCLDRHGNLVWRFQTGGAVDSSPAIGKDGFLVFGSYDGYLYCIKPDSFVHWKYRAGGVIRSSPVIGPDDSVYVGCEDGYIYSVSWSGNLRWKYNAGSPVWSSPALSEDGTIYFGAGDGGIYAIRADTGAFKWKYMTGTAVDSSPTVAADGTIYAGSGDGYLYALNPNGSLKWRYYTDSLVDSTLAIGPDGTLYVGIGHDWSSGTLYALNPNGTVKWTFDTHGNVRSSPAVDSTGMIYVGAGNGVFYAINPNGTQQWSYDTNWALLSSAAIGRDGRVVIGTTGGSLITFKDSGIDDFTPPTTPVVVDGGAATMNMSSLSASWSSSDPETGVVEYLYAIGTWPGTDDIADWVSVGTQTSVTKTGLALDIGGVYYFSVKARNAARIWSPAGVSDGIQVIGSDLSMDIGFARRQPNESLVFLSDKIVTANFDPVFYIQEPNRIAGIKVDADGRGAPAVGSVVDLVGTLIFVNGEPTVRLSSMEPKGGVVVPPPVGMPIPRLAGGPPVEGLAWVEGGSGVTTVGLLAATWGRVVGKSTGCFYIDGEIATGQSAAIIKVDAPVAKFAERAVGSYVRVVGIISMEATATGYNCIIRPRSESDITILQ